jgi:hypothetical protein
MTLIFTLQNDQLRRTVQDTEGNVVWESEWEKYCPIYGEKIMDDYEIQMKEFSSFEITEVQRNVVE